MKACKPVTEKIKQSEVLRMKGTLKRVMSGVLSVITIASAVAQPMTAYAVEPERQLLLLKHSIRNWKR